MIDVQVGTEIQSQALAKLRADLEKKKLYLEKCSYVKNIKLFSI